MSQIKNNSTKKGEATFISGFVAGSVVGVILLYLFGTKSGRKVLTDLIQLSEQLEVDVKNFDLSKLESSSKKNKGISHSNLETVIEKIQQVLPSEETIQKYFAKDGKLLKSVKPR